MCVGVCVCRNHDTGKVGRLSREELKMALELHPLLRMTSEWQHYSKLWGGGGISYFPVRICISRIAKPNFELNQGEVDQVSPEGLM